MPEFKEQNPAPCIRFRRLLVVLVTVAASGLPAKAVNIHTTYLGGGFGRRGEADFVTDAVETSKATGKPVKVIWTREDDIQHDYYRPVSYVRMWGALDPSGNPVAFMQRIVQQSAALQIEDQGGTRLVGLGAGLGQGAPDVAVMVPAADRHLHESHARFAQSPGE